MTWTAIPSDGWIVVEPPGGVALGADVLCTGTCRREGTITFSVNPVLLSSAATTGSVRIEGKNAGESIEIAINASADFDTGVPGTSRAY